MVAERTCAVFSSAQVAPERTCAVFSSTHVTPEQASTVLSNAQVAPEHACAVFSSARVAPKQVFAMFYRVLSSFLEFSRPRARKFETRADLPKAPRLEQNYLYRYIYIYMV